MPQSPPAHAPQVDLGWLQPGDRMGEGDTELVLDILPAELASTAFQKLRDEVKWNVMVHKGPHSTAGVTLT